MPIFNPPACDIGVTFVLMPLLLKWQGIGTIFLGNVYELLEPGKKLSQTDGASSNGSEHCCGSGHAIEPASGVAAGPLTHGLMEGQR